jgi:hypothetical protein
LVRALAVLDEIQGACSESEVGRSDRHNVARDAFGANVGGVSQKPPEFP